LGLGRSFKFSKNRSDPIFGLLGYDEMPSMNLSTTRGKGWRSLYCVLYLRRVQLGGRSKCHSTN
jgi:hypothetical protein